MNTFTLTGKTTPIWRGNSIEIPDDILFGLKPPETMQEGKSYLALVDGMGWQVLDHNNLRLERPQWFDEYGTAYAIEGWALELPER